MRDNFNMLPMVHDNINCVPGLKSMTTISSNGYYGYQPPLNKLKEEQQPPCHMEVEHYHERNSRKRNCDHHQDDFKEFKKRRQNEKITNFKKKVEPQDELDEELLREIHGCTIYHWMSDAL